MAGAGNGTTPVMPGRRVAASQRSTVTPQHRMPVSGPEQGPQRYSRRTPTAAVTGPKALENGGRMETPHPVPPLAGATARNAHPCPPRGRGC